MQLPCRGGGVGEGGQAPGGPSCLGRRPKAGRARGAEPDREVQVELLLADPGGLYGQEHVVGDGLGDAGEGEVDPHEGVEAPRAAVQRPPDEPGGAAPVVDKRRPLPRARRGRTQAPLRESGPTRGARRSDAQGARRRRAALAKRERGRGSLKSVSGTRLHSRMASKSSWQTAADALVIPRKSALSLPGRPSLTRQYSLLKRFPIWRSASSASAALGWAGDGSGRGSSTSSGASSELLSSSRITTSSAPPHPSSLARELASLQPSELSLSSPSAWCCALRNRRRGAWRRDPGRAPLPTLRPKQTRMFFSLPASKSCSCRLAGMEFSWKTRRSGAGKQSSTEGFTMHARDWSRVGMGTGEGSELRRVNRPSDHLQVQVEVFLQTLTATNGLQQHRCAASGDASEGKIQPYTLLIAGRQPPKQLRGHLPAPAVLQRGPLRWGLGWGEGGGQAAVPPQGKPRAVRARAGVLRRTLKSSIRHRGWARNRLQMRR
jgi:hypothetical protein